MSIGKDPVKASDVFYGPDDLLRGATEKEQVEERALNERFNCFATSKTGT